MPISAAKQKLLEKRNKEIYQMYVDEENPRSYDQIARIMTYKGFPISRQHVGLVIRQMEEERTMDA